MPRKPRIQYAGACYHVMSRGDRREAIFLDDEDRRRFLDAVGEVCERAGWMLHSYVLMSNHYHWLLETPEPNLAEGMKWFQGTYTQRFNLRHHLSGHVFQGRYKAIPLDPDDPGYVQRLWVYIHLNPVRAKLVDPRVEKLARFVWSSHAEFMKAPSRRPGWLCIDRVLGTLGMDGDTPASRRRYSHWMQERAVDAVSPARAREFREEWRSLRRGWYQGDEAFRERMLEEVEAAVTGNQRSSYSGAAIQEHDEGAARRLLEQVLQEFGFSLAEARAMKKSSEFKQGLVWLLKKKRLVGNAWIAEALNMGDRRNITRAVRAVEEARTGSLLKLRAGLTKMSQCPD